MIILKIYDFNYLHKLFAIQKKYLPLSKVIYIQDKIGILRIKSIRIFSQHKNYSFKLSTINRKI